MAFRFSGFTILFWQMWEYDWKGTNNSNERALVSFWILVLSQTLSALRVWAVLKEHIYATQLCNDQRTDTWINDRFEGTSPEALFCSHCGSRMAACFVKFVAVCIPTWNGGSTQKTRPLLSLINMKHLNKTAILRY